MRVPLSEMYTVVSYLLKQKWAGRERFPMVLMLEPLYRCNLSCAGCGKIQYPSNVLKSQLSVEECMRAVDECGTPIVSLPGGEPLLHPEIDKIVEGLVARKKYIHLCTNALLLEEKLDLFTPSKYLTFTVHLDGLEEEHDLAVCREGTYQIAISALRKAIDRGFRVTTNTTLFDGADPERTADFFDHMMDLDVEGMMISPGYAYDKAPEQGRFLGQDRTRQFFRRVFADRKRARRWRFNQSPLFVEYLTGAQDYDCTPWAMPVYSVFGWQKPCYLLQDGYTESYQQLLDETRWQDYGHASGNDQCQDCMVHSGFEASAVNDGFSSLRGFAAMARAFVFGPKSPPPAPEEPPKRLAVVEAADAPSQGWAADASPEALRVAFEYRGDVTLTLADGSRVEGYVANLGDTDLRLWNKGSVETHQVPVGTIARVELSGRDTASGRSYQTWLRQYEERKAAASA